MTTRPKRLLTQNSELAKDGIWCWSIPALSAKLSDGGNFVTCPHAGSCAQFCYARNGTYNFPAVKLAHTQRLEFYLSNPAVWVEAMAKEIEGKRRIPYLRIHDSGDFFSWDYLLDWTFLATVFSKTTFYAYTKEVSMFKKAEAMPGMIPSNFKYLFSMGGREDHLVDKEVDRHAEVFPSMEALLAAGYMDQSENDLLAINLPTNKIGIVANNIPHFNKKMDGRTFGGIQLEMVGRKADR